MLSNNLKNYLKKLLKSNLTTLDIEFEILGYLIKISDIKDRNVLMLLKTEMEVDEVKKILFDKKNEILSNYNFSKDFFDILKIEIYKITDITNEDNIIVNNNNLFNYLKEKNFELNEKDKILFYFKNLIKNNFCNINFKYITNYFSKFNEPFILINELNIKLSDLNNKFLTKKTSSIFHSKKIKTINKEISNLKKILEDINLKENKNLLEDKTINELDKIIDNLILNISF